MFCAEQWPEKHFILFIYSELLQSLPSLFLRRETKLQQCYEEILSLSAQSEELEICLQASSCPKDILLFVSMKEKKERCQR